MVFAPTTAVTHTRTLELTYETYSSTICDMYHAAAMNVPEYHMRMCYFNFVIIMVIDGCSHVLRWVESMHNKLTSCLLTI